MLSAKRKECVCAPSRGVERNLGHQEFQTVSFAIAVNGNFINGNSYTIAGLAVQSDF